MYVRPLLDYCVVIYNIPFVAIEYDSLITLSSSMERLEKVQYQAALAVTGCWQGTNRNKLYDELGWETLAHRQWARRLFHLFKGISTKSSASRRIRIYGSGSAQTFHEIRCNKNKYRDSFSPKLYQSME